MSFSNKKLGFTLIEVVVALGILGLVLGGTISAVHQYADQRVHMNSKILSNQVAWNILLEQYQESEVKKFHSKRSNKVKKGRETQYGQDWNWQLFVEPAVGKDLYRYEAKVSANGSDRTAGSLSIYIIEN